MTIRTVTFHFCTMRQTDHGRIVYNSGFITTDEFDPSEKGSFNKLRNTLAEDAKCEPEGLTIVSLSLIGSKP